MNIKDYNKVMMRMNADPELKEEIMEKCEKKSVRRSVSKKKFVPLVVAAVVCCVSIPAVFASEFMGIFKKSMNFEMAITDIEQPESMATGTEQINAENLNVYSARPKKWEKEDVVNIFAKDEKIADTQSYKFSQGYVFSGGELITFENNAELGYCPGHVSYDASGRIYSNDHIYPDLNMLENYFSSIFNPDRDPDFKLKSDELEGFEKEKAVMVTDDIISKLGISVLPEKTIYSLDVDTLKKFEDYRKIYSFKENYVPQEFTKEQEAYMIIYTAEYDDIPASPDFMEYGKYWEKVNWYTEGSEIYAVVSKNGVEIFNAYLIYEAEEIKNNISICTAKQAADVICNKFDKKVANYPTSFENCRLVYHAAKDGISYELRPYWEFRSVIHSTYYTLYPEKVEEEYEKYYYVDAETLELLESDPYDPS